MPVPKRTIKSLLEKNETGAGPTMKKYPRVQKHDKTRNDATYTRNRKFVKKLSAYIN